MPIKLFEVSLLAEDIQVTADSPSMADRYANEDARECRPHWNYVVTHVAEAPGGSVATEDPYDVALRVTQVGKRVTKGAGQLYTFNLSCEVIIAVEDEAAAGVAAISLITGSIIPQYSPG
jgi:hypothetical protein